MQQSFSFFFLMSFYLLMSV